MSNAAAALRDQLPMRLPAACRPLLTVEEKLAAAGIHKATVGDTDEALQAEGGRIGVLPE